MVDPNSKETLADTEKDSQDVIASPDSKELENITKMVGFLISLNDFIVLD